MLEIIDSMQADRYFSDTQDEVKTNLLRHYYNQLYKSVNAYYQNSDIDISFDEFKGSTRAKT